MADHKVLIAKVLEYGEGLGRYDFSRLNPHDRDNAAFDAWQEIKQELKSALAQRDNPAPTFATTFDNTKVFQSLGPTATVLHHRGLMYSIVADWSEDPNWRIHFKIYEITGEDLSTNSPSPLYWRSESNDYETDFSKATPFLDGYVVRDGCSDWRFRELLVHRCNKEGLENIGKVMALCWEWTAELCPSWNPY
jgi:hypothetical protein